MRDPHGISESRFVGCVTICGCDCGLRCDDLLIAFRNTNYYPTATDLEVEWRWGEDRRARERTRQRIFREEKGENR